MKSCSLNFLPNENQKLLLISALKKGNQAINAWEEWAKRVDINDIDNASYQLIPKIYKNLASITQEFSHYQLIKGIYKHNWVNNQLLFSEFAHLMNEWPQLESTKVILLKGAVMIANYYRDFGVRLLGDIDVLIPKENIGEFASYLMRSSFTSSTPLSREGSIIEGNLKPHAISFMRERAMKLNPLNIDVHYMPLQEISFMEDKESSWFEDIDPVKINNVGLWGLAPTHLLFQTCVHGLRHYQVPALRWILDAVVLINSAAHRIDWDSIISRAKSYDLILPIKTAFNFLYENFEAEIPEHILKRLNTSPVSSLDRWEFFHKSKQADISLITIFLSLWFQSRRQKIGFLDYLRKAYQVQSYSILGLIIFKKCMKYFFGYFKKLILLSYWKQKYQDN